MIKARKTNKNTLIKPGRTTVPPEQLIALKGFKQTSLSNKFQYKLLFENKTLFFRNFKELKFYSNINLRNSQNYVILDRYGDKVAKTRIFTCVPANC